MNEPNSIQLLTIDLDDTLWPCMPTIKHAEETSYNWLQQNRPKITACYSRDELLAKRKQLMREQPELKHDLSEARRAHFRQLADECGYDHDWVEEGFRVFHRARQKVQFYDDVLPVLGRLKSMFKLVALTNGNADIHMVGLSDYFDLQISAADVVEGKPHPAMFERAMKLLQISPEQSLHVGDHAIHDVYGARNAGIQSVWVNRQGEAWTETEFTADYEIPDLKGLFDILQLE